MLTFVLIIMVASFLTSAAIVVRKFPQLANVDLDSLPQEKEARKKKELLDRRMAVESSRMAQTMFLWLQPVGKLWRFVQNQFRNYVTKVESLWHHEERAEREPAAVPASVEASEDTDRKIFRLLQEAATNVQVAEYDQAESKYITVISLDPKSVPAYRGLATVYYAKGAINEAVETLDFVLKLQPEDDAALVKLAEIAEDTGDNAKAIEYYERAVVANDALSPRFYHLAELLLKEKQPEVAKEAILSALELEPKNPKYLDLLVEVGIQCGDKDLAEQGIQDLRLLNPKNQKLVLFQDRIRSLTT